MQCFERFSESIVKENEHPAVALKQLDLLPIEREKNVDRYRLPNEVAAASRPSEELIQRLTVYRGILIGLQTRGIIEEQDGMIEALISETILLKFSPVFIMYMQVPLNADIVDPLDPANDIDVSPQAKRAPRF